MKKSDIIDAYVRIRKNDHSIPDDVLDFMYHSAIEKFDELNIDNEEKAAQEKARRTLLNEFKL